MQQLVISLLGEDRAGLVNQIAQVIADEGLNIVDSRMTVLGGEFAIIMLAEGDNAAVEGVEQHLPQLQEKLQLTIVSKRTSQRQLATDTRPYKIEVIAIDNPGIVRELASFFDARNINIEDLDTGTYAAPHTGTRMFKLEMVVKVPADTNSANLRESFFDYCEERNLDASMEACR